MPLATRACARRAGMATAADAEPAALTENPMDAVDETEEAGKEDQPLEIPEVREVPGRSDHHNTTIT